MSRVFGGVLFTNNLILFSQQRFICWQKVSRIL